MFKNIASQKVALFAFDITTGAPKTGDAANITPYVSKDYGSVTALGTATAVEMDATNAKGWYSFTLAQAETNGDALLFTAKSSTANVSLVGALIYSVPPNFTTTVIDGSGNVNATAVKVGPSGAATAQTAADLGAGVNVTKIGGTATKPRYTGTAQAGTGSTLTLAASTTSLQCGAGDLIEITGGTGQGESGIVQSVSGMGTGTPIVTMEQNWLYTNPDNTSTYEITKTGALLPYSPGVVNGRLDVNVGSVVGVNATATGGKLDVNTSTIIGTAPTLTGNKIDSNIYSVDGVVVQQNGNSGTNIAGP